MMRWQSSNRIWWETAPPYTLNVPPALPGALSMAQPEFSWAQSLVVAMHSVKIDFGDNVTYSEVSLDVVGDELDSFRRWIHSGGNTILLQRLH
ncbi:MAG: hypothetical protein ACKPKO_03220, partial [Candidatus Fonsibacter sp.]